MTDTAYTCKSFHCPSCQGNSRITFTLIPASRLQFKQDGENHTFHFPTLRDYKCHNCDHEWLQSGGIGHD